MPRPADDTSRINSRPFFLAMTCVLLYLHPARAQVRHHRLQALFVYQPQPSPRHAQNHAPTLVRQVKSPPMQIRQKTPLVLVVRVRHAMTAHRTLAGHLAHSGHFGWFSRWEILGRRRIIPLQPRFAQISRNLLIFASAAPGGGNPPQPQIRPHPAVRIIIFCPRAWFARRENIFGENGFYIIISMLKFLVWARDGNE